MSTTEGHKKGFKCISCKHGKFKEPKTYIISCRKIRMSIKTKIIKITHTGKTRPPRMCVIQEYRFYTMSLSQYHGFCQYHETISIPWVLVNTMCPCLYHDSMSIPRVHVNTISPCLYYESISIAWVLVNSMHPCLYNEFFPIIWVNVHSMSQEIKFKEINQFTEI